MYVCRLELITKDNDLDYELGSIIDLNSFAMNIDGYLNAIYLRHKNATGTAVIHRKCVALLGSKTLSCIQLLANRVDLILQAYKNACSQKPELK